MRAMLTFAVLLMDLRSNIPTEPSARLWRKSLTLTLREGVMLKEGWSDVRHERFKSFTRMQDKAVGQRCARRRSFHNLGVAGISGLAYYGTSISRLR